MKTKVTVIYEMDDSDAQHLIEGVKTRMVMGATGAIVACYQGDALAERDELKQTLADLAVSSTSELINPLIAEAINTNPKNYTGKIYEITKDGGARGDVLVTVQFLDGKSPHELLQEAKQDLATLYGQMEQDGYDVPEILREGRT